MRKTTGILLSCALLSAGTAATAQRPGGGGGGGPDNTVDRMMGFDRDKDGKLTRAEVTDDRLLRLFDRADLDRRMTGIAWGHSDAFLDEHPDAYKPIDQVMADAADLVEIRHTLRQFINVKGD